MQIKKEILLFCLLIVLSVSLLVAADVSSKKNECLPGPAKSTECCCKEPVKSKTESPWNFITGGVLHLSI